MNKVVTFGCCTNSRNVYCADTVELVLDTPAYSEPQVIASFALTSLLIISRVNKVDKRPNGLLIVHIA